MRLERKLDKVRRLFVDPASKSTGWALFVGKKLEASGTVAVQGVVPVRLWKIFDAYRGIMLEQNPDEVHVENFRRNLAIQLHWSVGVIMAAAGFYAVPAQQDCWMSSWQRYCGFKKGGPFGKLSKYEKKTESEDELSAIGIGLWYVNVKLKE